ncbi:MAG: ABC transporter ATP-binding protein [Promethearchaeota archaeon]
MMGRPGGRRGPGRGGPGGHMAAMDDAKATDFGGTMKKLIRYLGRYKSTVLVVIFFAILSTTASIVGPKILGKATTKLFEGIFAQLRGTGTIDFEYIGRIIIITLSLYFFSAIFSYIQGWLMANVSTNVAYRFRRDIAEKINRLPLKYFDGTTHGEVLSRITNDVDTINQSLSQSITQLITSTVTVIGVMIMMFSINWILTLVILVTLPLSMFLIRFIIKISQKYFRHQQDYLGHINSHVEEIYGGHIVMKAFNGEKKSYKKFDKNNKKLYNYAWKSQFLSGLMMPIMLFIGNLGYVLVAIIGGWLTAQSNITIGDIQAFLQYTRSFSQPLSQLANISNTLQQTAASSERVFEFLEEEEESPENINPVKLEKVSGKVEFKDVHFGYKPDKIVIKKFSAVARPGHKIAIVGPTGAGKTTIVKLLMRYYDLVSGAIYIDGHDIKDFTRHDLRDIFGMVLQDTWLYNDTLLENIRYGRPDATDDEVYEAAKAAHVDHFAHTLTGGYHMILNEETTNISQGQKQLITIARAVLANPKILILDEATSSVDTRTEILIQKAMDDLMKNRTSFVIAHRLSTIRDADLILVLNEGDIVEQGTHEELLALNGFYADLHNSQFNRTPEIMPPVLD